ncbi:CPXCG motif-containing cysteine-rich protein [Aequorivita viscosa]|uniref:Cysteine-rich CPXCG n=1 Tax=Aequorivita viscosa TaxID=797419 RepID=A0A1M6L398_9FLAO|nr:CPXCG motif-containing cysteine-rich protein [Aequorivita viscosa]SDX23647.1 Cysteine-rich CPXCG [Aequorivita viscosa]SHJ65705.1 Cysteine-rich CPXCG [Aequorivita viscosa]
MKEHFFQCPFCWESVSVLLDSSIPNQKYIEDCEVCCNPLEIEVAFINGELTDFNVRSIGQ